ncbi:MAG TPA: hypothetical protein VNI53_03020 [Gammaproteobacteria bacterium]|nr:hypothetical protein [Gammaproteobacteria bacterium]
MNLRLSPGSVRVRLSRSELDVLLSTGEISSGTRLAPHHEFTYRVTLDDNAPELLLDTTENGLQLRLSGTHVRELAARLPSKQGIEMQQADGRGGMLALSLEVDLHGRRNTTR